MVCIQDMIISGENDYFVRTYDADNNHLTLLLVDQYRNLSVLTILLYHWTIGLSLEWVHESKE